MNYIRHDFLTTPSRISASPEVKNPESRFAVLWIGSWGMEATAIPPWIERNRKMGQGKQAIKSDAPCTLALDRPLKVLTSRQIQQIDDALAGLGPFAEVRLIKNKGRLRFIQKVESESMLGPSEPR
jgi:hypothetical protein